MRLVLITFRKQRPDGPIDHPAIEYFSFGRLTFTFEKSAWDFSGCVEIFTVIYGEWEEVQTFPWFSVRTSCHQYDGLSVTDQCSSIGLFCQLSDLDREFSLSDHRTDFMNVHEYFLSPLYFNSSQFCAPIDGLGDVMDDRLAATT